MIEELIDREKMSFGVINILLQFVMLKEDMKLPKSYIFEIASNWKKKILKQLSKRTTMHFKLINLKVMTKISKGIETIPDKTSNLFQKRKLQNGLKIERLNQIHQLQNSTTKDEKLEKDRKAFLERLNKKWEEGNE